MRERPETVSVTSHRLRPTPARWSERDWRARVPVSQDNVLRQIRRPITVLPEYKLNNVPQTQTIMDVCQGHGKGQQLTHVWQKQKLVILLKIFVNIIYDVLAPSFTEKFYSVFL